MLHAGAREKLLFSLRRESSSLRESSRELSFATTRIVAQVRFLVQARAISPKRGSLA